MNKTVSPLAETLVPRIRRAAQGPGVAIFVASAAGSSEPVKVPWSQLHEEAIAVAANLQARGVCPGDHIAILGLTTRALVTTLQGIWLAGACVIMIPIPLRLNSMEEFMRQTRAHLYHGDAKLLLLDSDLASFYEAKPGDPPVILLSDLQPGPGHPTASDFTEVADDPHRLAILQFTSGSTSEPKGVMLPHHAVGANIDGINKIVTVSKSDDVLVSWLPLYHDMGLIGVLCTSMTIGCSLVLSAPQDFLSRPANWMRWMSEYNGTLTAGPNFSYVLAARALQRMSDSGEYLDLSKVRLALNGAEPIDPDTVEIFINAAGKHGFRPGAIFCAFGMAEVTIAGSYPPVMRGMVCDTVDRIALESERVARPAEPTLPTSRRFPLLGSPMPGLEMRICHPETGLVLGEREAGELQIRGNSITTGYYKRPDLTDALFQDDWIHTGDLGYLVKGPNNGPLELVLCGRLKDLIIIGGRNIYPEDIERAVGAIEEVRTGNVIAFSVDTKKGKESIVVVAEVRTGNLKEVRRNIRKQVIGVCAVPPRDIMLIQPGTLPKTSSGKLQRSLCRKQYMLRELKLAGDV
ncbi:MAG TPA: AMP-binding protein [Candidatus Limnocylindrales bacterium]|nr:AMP-binding protein [Candidatus Limnocylindrales bacterium]